MDVQVKNGLAGAGTDVEHGAITVLNLSLTRNIGGREMALTDNFSVGAFGFFQSRKMSFWNDEHMRGSLRVDVFESKDVLVFVDLLRGNFAADKAAE